MADRRSVAGGATVQAIDGGGAPAPARSPEESEFLRLIVTLLTFVMARTSVPPVLAHGPARDPQTDLDVASDALDILWSTPRLIDEFLDENPARLSKRDLGTIAAWRNPVMGRFVVTDAQRRQFVCIPADAGMPLRLFVVHLIRREADELFLTLPCLVELVLLPFRGMLVTDGRIKRISSTIASDGFLAIEDHFRLAAFREPIRTPETLIEVARARSGKAAGATADDSAAEPSRPGPDGRPRGQPHAPARSCYPQR